MMITTTCEPTNDNSTFKKPPVRRKIEMRKQSVAVRFYTFFKVIRQRNWKKRLYQNCDKRQHSRLNASVVMLKIGLSVSLKPLFSTRKRSFRTSWRRLVGMRINRLGERNKLSMFVFVGARRCLNIHSRCYNWFLRYEIQSQAAQRKCWTQKYSGFLRNSLPHSLKSNLELFLVLFLTIEVGLKKLVWYNFIKIFSDLVNSRWFSSLLSIIWSYLFQFTQKKSFAAQLAPA